MFTQPCLWDTSGVNVKGKMDALYTRLDRVEDGHACAFIAINLKPGCRANWYAALGYHLLPDFVAARALRQEPTNWVYEHIKRPDWEYPPNHSVVPRACKLYLDVEYKRVDYPDAPEDDTFSQLIEQYVTDVVAWVWGGDVTVSEMFVLDASNQTKFSRHIVVQLWHESHNSVLLFSDVYQVRAFVFGALLRQSHAREWLGMDEAQWSAGPPVPPELLYTVGVQVPEGRPSKRGKPLSGPGTQTTSTKTITHNVIDHTVYERSQLFRLPLCAKADAPDRVLRFVHPGTRVKSGPESDEWFLCSPEGRRIWLSSLITYQPPETRALLVTYSVPKKNKKKRKRREVVPRSERRTGDRSVWGVWCQFWTLLARHIAGDHGDDKIMPDRAGPSQSQDSAMRKGTKRAQLASRAFAKTGPGGTFTDGFLPTYTKDCVIKGGAHSSNHIWWAVDLVRRVYWQSCHNPTCAASLAETRITHPLPPKLVRLAQSALNAQTLS